MGEASDDRLVRSATAGDAEAFGELVKRYLRGMYALAYSFVQNHADADDLCQEAFLRAYRSLDSFKGRSSFRTWLYRIATNVCVNHVNRKAPEAEPLEDSVPAERAVASGGRGHLNPLEAAGLSELEERVAMLTGQLPVDLRVALHLIVSEGLSHKEAAQVLGCAESTVSWRLFRARQLLLSKLSAFLDGRSNGHEM